MADNQEHSLHENHRARMQERRKLFLLVNFELNF